MRLLVRSAGYKAGTANPALYFNKQRNSRGAVRGDELVLRSCANRSAIDHIGKVLAYKCKLRESHRLGFGEHWTKTSVALNRITALSESERRNFFRSTQRHAAWC